MTNLFKPFTVASKDEITQILRKSQVTISELTFTNLFTWNDYYQFQYALFENILDIVAFPKDQEAFAFYPISPLPISNHDLSLQMQRLKETFSVFSQNLQYKKLTRTQKEHLSQLGSKNFHMTLERDQSDYIYASDDLIHLLGKKYDGKRNHIRKFNKKFSYKLIPMVYHHVEDCKHILENWYKTMVSSHNYALFYEQKALMNFFQNFKNLECIGALLMVDDSLEAFCIGEILNDETAVIHFEKANTAIPGIYQVLNQAFCSTFLSHIKYINREQDLGVEGLRKAKLSYHPVKLIEKYRAVEID